MMKDQMQGEPVFGEIGIVPQMQCLFYIMTDKDGVQGEENVDSKFLLCSI